MARGPWASFILCTAISMVTVAVSAQQHRATPLGIPRSSRVIEGEVTLPKSGRDPAVTVKFEIQDGTLLTVEDHRKREYFFGFSGTFNPATETPNIIPWRIRSYNYGRVGITELGQSKQYASRKSVALRDLPAGRQRIFPAAGRIRLRISGTHARRFAAPSLIDVDLSPEELWAEIDEIGDYGHFSKTSCCVTCQGVTVCAGSVSTSCGACTGAFRH